MYINMGTRTDSQNMAILPSWYTAMIDSHVFVKDGEVINC